MTMILGSGFADRHIFKFFDEQNNLIGTCPLKLSEDNRGLMMDGVIIPASDVTVSSFEMVDRRSGAKVLELKVLGIEDNPNLADDCIPMYPTNKVKAGVPFTFSHPLFSPLAQINHS